MIDLSEAISLADRILILSSRPGRLRRIVRIEMPPRLTPMERRNHSLFKDYFNILWEELHDENKND